MRYKGFSIIVLVLLASLILAACGGGGTTTQNPTAATTGGAAATSAPAGGEATAAPASGAAGGQSGKVFILGAFAGAEATAFQPVIDAFKQANPGIDVTYSGINDFDTQIVVKVQAGDTPDIAAFPQPGGAARQARDGQLVPLWPEITALIDKNYPSFWKDLGSVDGTPYGVFHRVNAKGWIWYNKTEFEKAGYTAPKTWDELTALTDKMKASGTPPWCEGIGAGAATGWKGTDWIENIMLRTQSTDVYDQWTAGKLPFTSPEVKNAFEILGKIWTDPTAVYGGPQTIALTQVPDAANFLFDSPPKCWLHMQGSFVLNFFTNEDVKKNPDKYLGVFIMPPIDPKVTPALEVGGDEFVVMKGKDRPEVKKFMEFLTTWESGVPWAKQGGALFPYKTQDFSVYPTQIEKTLAQTIAQAQAARFDASDAMPAALNQAFWKGTTDWVSGNRDLDGALQDIDAARPK